MSSARSHLVAGIVFSIGALSYALAVGTFELTFNATPLWFGATAALAGVASRQPRLLSIATVLIGWGAAVLLVREGPVPRNREAAAFLVGAGLGMVTARYWSRRAGVTSTGAAFTLLSGGLAFYLAYDVDALGRWPAWTVLMLVWAAFELVGAVRLQPTRA